MNNQYWRPKILKILTKQAGDELVQAQVKLEVIVEVVVEVRV